VSFLKRLLTLLFLEKQYRVLPPTLIAYNCLSQKTTVITLLFLEKQTLIITRTLVEYNICPSQKVTGTDAFVFRKTISRINPNTCFLFVVIKPE